jgi:hypothetical protein
MDWLNIRENVLLVLPSKSKMYLDISKTDNNFIIFHNLISGYYTSGKYSSELDLLKKAYFDFTWSDPPFPSLTKKILFLNWMKRLKTMNTSMSWY